MTKDKVPLQITLEKMKSQKTFIMIFQKIHVEFIVLYVYL